MRKPKPSPVVGIQPKQREASFALIGKWGETICRSSDDPQTKLAAFLLLMDEIERAGNEEDHTRVGLIAWTAQQAAFGNSEQADKAREQFLEELRAKRGLRVVAKKREAA